MSEFKLDIAHICDLYSVLYRFGKAAEKLCHFVTALDIELLCRKFKLVGIVKRCRR